jgi:hypothetical protein
MHYGISTKPALQAWTAGPPHQVALWNPSQKLSAVGVPLRRCRTHQQKQAGYLSRDTASICSICSPMFNSRDCHTCSLSTALANIPTRASSIAQCYIPEICGFHSTYLWWSVYGCPHSGPQLSVKWNAEKRSRPPGLRSAALFGLICPFYHAILDNGCCFIYVACWVLLIPDLSCCLVLKHHQLQDHGHKPARSGVAEQLVALLQLLPPSLGEFHHIGV